MTLFPDDSPVQQSGTNAPHIFFSIPKTNYNSFSNANTAFEAKPALVAALPQNAMADQALTSLNFEQRSPDWKVREFETVRTIVARQQWVSLMMERISMPGAGKLLQHYMKANTMNKTASTSLR